MYQELREKDLVTLCDMLVDKTILLLKVLEQKKDPALLHQLKEEVELIQSVIKSKQASKDQGDGESH